MFHILIPPLRERKEDIARLIQFVLHNMSVGQGKKALELDPIAEEILVEFAWPGNVRELENVINRAYILADGERITLADLPPDIARSVQSRESSGIEFASNTSLREQLRHVEAEIISRALREASGDRRIAAQKLDIGLSSLYRKLEEMEVHGVGKE